MKTRVMQSEPEGSGAAAIVPPAARVPSTGRGRAIGGIAAAAVGVAALVGGAALVAVDSSQRDGDGFFASDTHALSTSTPALVSDGLDVDAPGWLLEGDVRVRASAAGGEPVFLGVARQSDIDAYLDGVGHEVADFGSAASPDRTVTPGVRAARPPASQGFWAAQVSGTGTQTVVWPLEEGEWAAVVMNADGSAGVRTATSIGLNTGLVLWIGIGVLIAGTALVGTGTALIVSGRRRARETRRADATT